MPTKTGKKPVKRHATASSRPRSPSASSRLEATRAARRPVPANTGWGSGGEDEEQPEQERLEDETALHLTRAAEEDDEEDEDEEWSDGEDDDEDEEDEDEEDEEDEEDAHAWGRARKVSSARGERLYTAEDYLDGVEVPMPSGKAFLLRPVSLLTLMRLGQLPNHLQAAAERMMYGGDSAKIPAGNRQDRRSASRQSGRVSEAQSAKDTTALIDYLVRLLVANIKVVNKPQERCRPGELSIAKVWEADKLEIIRFAMDGQRELGSFRSDA